MTTENSVDLNSFIVALTEAPYRWIKDASENLNDEQLYHQPTADTNSIAWLIWHLSRWRDKISAAAAGESQVWVKGGWDKRFGMSSDRTGLGDTTEQVASFRIGRAELFGYAESAHNALVEWVASLSIEQLEQEIEYNADQGSPAWPPGPMSRRLLCSTPTVTTEIPVPTSRPPGTSTAMAMVMRRHM